MCVVTCTFLSYAYECTCTHTHMLLVNRNKCTCPTMHTHVNMHTYNCAYKHKCLHPSATNPPKLIKPANQKN